MASGLAFATQACASTTVAERSRIEADGRRTMDPSIEVPTPPSVVWAALTTTEGWRSWAAPVAHVDFRLRGIIETSYHPGGRVAAPATSGTRSSPPCPGGCPRSATAGTARTAFDVRTFQSLHAVVLVELLAAGPTRFRVIQPGCRPGEPSDTVYRHFAAGNARKLEQLKTRFKEGPIDWKRSAPEAVPKK